MQLFTLTYTDTDLSILVPVGETFQRAHVMLPANSVVSGVITNPKEFSTLVKQTLTSQLSKSVSTFRVIVGLPEEHAFIKVLELPAKLKQKELESTLSFQWQSILPIAADNVYYDYRLLQKPDKRKGNKQYLLVAYSKEIVNSVIQMLHELDVMPERIIPLSFGYAGLLSPKSGTATLVLSSEDNKSLSVAVVQDGTARFSTVIHAPITAPNCLKQLQNIIMFYNQGVNNPNEKIAMITVVRSRYAPLMVQQFASFSLPIQTTRTDQFLRTKNTKKRGHESNVPLAITKDNQTLKIKGATSYLYEIDHYTPLFGLLGLTALSLSIFPPAFKDERIKLQQLRFARSSLFLSTIVLSSMLILSLSLLRWLLIANKTKVDTSPVVVQSISKQEGALSEQVTQVNTQLSQLATLSSKRSNASENVDHFYTLAKLSPGISITKISYNPEHTLLAVSGTRKDRASLNQFLDKLRQSKLYSSVSPAITSLQAEGQSDFDINLTVAAGGAS